MESTVNKIHPSLPIFRLDTPEESILYTPGHLVMATRKEADALHAAFVAHGEASTGHVGALGTALQHYAAEAVEAWQHLSEAPFKPECLTIYLSNYCNLGCPYCYAAYEDGSRSSNHAEAASRLPVINEDVVRAAARTVARHCAGKGKPFTLVLHGGGEPTLHWTLLQRIVYLTQQVAEDHGLAWWGYVATNGVITEEKARWLAGHFDLIGLSCDGPPAIQDTQRPRHRGADTSSVVERTAGIFSEMGAAFTARATITPETAPCQAEIVRYLHSRLGAEQIKFEPVYRANGMRQCGFAPEDAPVFTRYFLEAEGVAEALGCTLSLSGIRLDEIHGPYCNVLRDVLHLTPDGGATACFLCMDSRQPEQAGMAVGHLDPATGTFALNETRIARIRRQATRIPARCRECVNIYHCARECPEVCPAVGEETDPLREGGFRCRVQKQLGETWIRRAARDRHREPVS